MAEWKSLRFIEEPIETWFDKQPLFEKVPGCPSGFTWKEQAYAIVELISEWHDNARRGRMARNMRPEHAAVAAQRGSWGVGVAYFRVRTASGEVFDIYFDRSPRDASHRKGAWYLYRQMGEGDRFA